MSHRLSTSICTLLLLVACKTSTDPELGPAKLLVRNKLQVPITSAYVIGCAEPSAQSLDSLSERESIAPAAERTFRLSSAGCYDALFVREHTVQNEDGTRDAQVDTIGRRAHMMIEPYDIYVLTLMPQ